jgi:predicted nucleic acid-binding protein
MVVNPLYSVPPATVREDGAGARAVRGVSQIAPVKSRFKAVDEDPADDMILNTAIDGEADYIVSGDRHLRRLGRFKGVRIVSPGAFMTIVTRRFCDMILPAKDLE